MIWAFLIGFLLLGLAVIRYTFTLQHRKLNKEQEELRKNMDQFIEQLNKYKKNES